MKITAITGRQIIDSRGNPTVEAEVVLDGGQIGRAAVPSGASTGQHEAVELRDGDKAWGGKGVSKAVAYVNGEIKQALLGKDASEQSDIDRAMIDLDGTRNKGRLGANSILAVSLAVAQAAAAAHQQPLFRYVASLAGTTPSMPRPMMNIVNGGQHASGSTDIQEFMIVPLSSKGIAQSVQMGAEIFHALKPIVAASHYATTVGDEGGYAPAVNHGNREALDMITKAISDSGYKPGQDVGLALDVAASELFKDGKYDLKTEHHRLDAAQMVEWYSDLIDQYPIISIEDGLDQNDWPGWAALTAKLGNKVQLVGDDLLVTNTHMIEKAIALKSANAVLIKPNQIGTLTETIAAVAMAQQNGFKTIMSHRSGETEDVSIAHLAVGLGAGQIKTGSLSRGERTAKYNELLRISEQL
ncbi:MAG: enolase [Patescibacteria group bacterium]|nr:enolase [Patescibacteria group bacterium]